MIPQPKVKPIARKAKSKTAAPSAATASLLALIQASLEDGKAEDIAVIDMAGKSAVADFMVIATGRSQRQVAAMANHLREKIKAAGHRAPPIEGLSHADWVLVDAGDVVVHLFRPEVRAFYNLEKMWSQALPDQGDGMEGLIKEKLARPKAAKRKPKKGKPGAKPAARRKPAASATARRRAAG